MASDEDYQAQLRALREENEALRFASLKFGELSERLTKRVRELERRVRLYQRLCAAHGEPLKCLPTPQRARGRGRETPALRRS